MATFLLTLLMVALAVLGLAAGRLLAGRPLRRGCPHRLLGSCAACPPGHREGETR